MSADFEGAFNQSWTGAQPNGSAQSGTGGRRPFNLKERGAERFIGQPPLIKWLVEGNVPLGVPVLIAAMGDTGKSYLALQLCYHVSRPPTGDLSFHVPVLGGQVVAHGTAVFITTEDSDPALHRRVDVLDPTGHRHKHPGKLIVVALPSDGGARPFFVRHPRNGVRATEDWVQFCTECEEITDLKLVVIDPLAAFAMVALDKDSTDAQFVAAELGALAARTGATVIALHHMRKGPEAPKNVAEARDRIRGSSGIVDGVRCAYALWPVDESEGRKVCNALSIPYSPTRVVKGAVVKANEQASREIATYVRNDAGLLLDRTGCLRARAPDTQTMHDSMIEGIRNAALAGQPFTETGASGVYKLRERLPEPLRAVARHKLEALVQELVELGKIVRCVATGGNQAKWLDVPGGPFTGAVGGESRRGAVR